MSFMLDYGLDKSSHVYMERLACKGLVMKENKLLMVTTNEGHCMFPGGGVDVGESNEAAVTREVLEETGYKCIVVGSHICRTHERKIDKYEPDKFTVLINDFYTCIVEDKNYGQNLEGYEINLEFKAEWLTVKEALEKVCAYRTDLKEGDFWGLNTIEILNRIKNKEIDLLKS